MGLLKLAGALLAYQAFITLQGCDTAAEDDTKDAATAASTATPDKATATTPAPTPAPPTPAPTQVVPPATKILTGDVAFTMDATSAGSVVAAFEGGDDAKKEQVS